MMDPMQPPQEAYVVCRHVLPVNGQIQRDDGDAGGEPTRKIQKSEDSDVVMGSEESGA